MLNPQNKNKCLKDICNCTPVIIGPTGPTGPQGPTTITIGTTTTTEPETSAKVVNSGTKENVILNFNIPRGNIGPTGPRGISDTIKIRNTTTTEAGTDAQVIDNQIENNHTLDFIIPRGPTGPAGPSLLKSSYIVTYNDNTKEDGISVASGERIPLGRIELDATNLVELNKEDKTISFSTIGYYKIFFTISAYPKVNTPDFDPTKDIVSVGFRLTNTDDVYVGVGQWVFNGEAVELVAQGIISVPNPNDKYELVNLSKETIYLNTPDIKNIASISYFSNPLVTMVIEYLGRQGL